MPIRSAAAPNAVSSLRMAASAVSCRLLARERRRSRVAAAVCVALVAAACGPVAAQAADGWSPAASMTSPRDGHAATLLRDGKVLVTGSWADTSAELYDPTTNTWSAAASMSTRHDGGTTTLLANGKVLVVGGWTGSVLTASAELYDPTTNSWSAAGRMSEVRQYEAAAPLADGKVLVTGGMTDDWDHDAASAELYDPATNTWSAAASMSSTRVTHRATPMANGKVLVTGGRQENVGLASAELYDPSTDTWSPAPSMSGPRLSHETTVLANGKVLVTGGYQGGDTGGRIMASAELYDPTTSTWSAVPDMSIPREDHTGSLLANGKVLVTGGWTYGERNTESTELYDPTTNTWSLAPRMSSERGEHAATVLADGRVLVTGGWTDDHDNTASAELYGLVDTDKPHIDVSATTAEGESYGEGEWTNQNVTVAFACVDEEGGSGVDEDASDLAASETVGKEGVTEKVDSHGDCVDKAGNSAEAVAFGPVNIDKTSPTISASARTADGAPYAAGGWTNQNVTVAFACGDGDGGSGVDEDASNLAATRTVSDESEHSVASSGTCADNAGNSAAATSFGPVKIDKTGPVLKFTGERTYTVDEQIEIGCSATDALSGVAAPCTGLSAPAHTYAPGTHTITRSATDNVGNETSASATFIVKVTPSSVCALTRQYVRGSAKYAAQSPAGRRVPDALATTACQSLAAIVPGITPQAKAALVLTYKVTVGVMTYGGWLTAVQASELKTLAGAL